MKLWLVLPVSLESLLDILVVSSWWSLLVLRVPYLFLAGPVWTSFIVRGWSKYQLEQRGGPAGPAGMRVSPVNVAGPSLLTFLTSRE